MKIILSMSMFGLLLCSCNSMKQEAPLSDSERAIKDSLNMYDSATVLNNIEEANNTYKIDAAKAYELLMQVDEIRKIKEQVYKDTSEYNEMVLAGSPKEFKPGWEFVIYHRKRGDNELKELQDLWVDANTGEILFILGEIVDDKMSMTVEEWRQWKKRK